MIAVNWPAFAKNTAARIVAAALVALGSLWLARCDGARHQSARDRQDAADAQAKTSESAAKHDAHVGDSVKAILADSMHDLKIAKARADTDVARALAHLGRITVIGPAKSPAGETRGASATEPGSVAAGAPPIDTTKYATIQRQGDPLLYVVPQFVVDLGAELRRAIAERSDEAAKAERNLAIARSASAADSNTIRDLRSALASRTTAENIAKSNAGQSCRIAFIIPCPPRWAAFTVGALGGAALGYEVAKR